MNKIHLVTSDEKLKSWGYGEWVEEPDEIYFDFKGIECKVLRQATKEPSLQFHVFGGYLCGYVAVPSDHAYYQKKYEDIPIDVHGGLTFGECSDKHWIGFDCGHSFDIIPSMKLLYKKASKMKEFREHYPFFLPWKQEYRNIDFCINECKSMVDQLLLIKQGSNK